MSERQNATMLRYRTGICLVAASVANIASICSAQTVQSAGPGNQTVAPDAPEIIVTANKREQSLSDVPASVSVVTSDLLKTLGVNNVQDLVKVTPGLTYVDSGSSVPVFSLRGVGFFDTAIGARPTVSVYTDEAPLPFSIQAQGAAFDLDRVEILKGPQGTLFGQNATGGAINYIAGKAQDTFGAGVTARYGRFNSLDSQGYVTGPIGSDMNIRVAGHTIQGGAWQKSYTRDDTNGDQNFWQGRVILDWEPNSNLRASLNINGFVDRGDTQAGQLAGLRLQIPSLASSVPLLVGFPLAPRNSRAANWPVGMDLQKHNSQLQANLRLDYELSPSLTVTSITSGIHTKVDAPNDIAGTDFMVAENEVTGRIRSFSEELRIAGRDRDLNWILGANFAVDSTRERDILFYPYSTGNFALDPNNSQDSTIAQSTQKFRSYAVFGNIDYSVTDRLTVYGGARYTKSDLRYTACTAVNDQTTAAAFTTFINRLRGASGSAPIPSLQPGQCLTLDAALTPGSASGMLNQDNISWRAGVKFKPSNDSMVYANISRGYKQGSLSVIGALTTAQYTPVTQESVLAYEIGLKVKALDRKVDLSGAAFYYDYSNKQLLGRALLEPTNLGPVQALVNIPRSRIWGAEAQITLYPVSGLMLSGAATYINSRVLGSYFNYSIIGARTDFGGSAFPYTPKWQAVGMAQYTTQISDDLNFVGNINYSYRSSTVAGFGADPILQIKSYGLLDLTAGVETSDRRWKFEAFGRNITNSYYWTNITKFQDVVRRLTGMPVTYGIQVSFRY